MIVKALRVVTKKKDLLVLKILFYYQAALSSCPVLPLRAC